MPGNESTTDQRVHLASQFKQNLAKTLLKSSRETQEILETHKRKLELAVSGKQGLKEQLGVNLQELEGLSEGRKAVI